MAACEGYVKKVYIELLVISRRCSSIAGFSAVRLDGSMAPEQRAAVIKSFMVNPQVTIFLVSLKAGGVALNLTEGQYMTLLGLMSMDVFESLFFI